MGKRIIPPQDPQRLNRVMDEKTRMIGVDISELERQAQERRERETSAAQAKAAEEARQLAIDAEVQRKHTEAENIRKKNAEMLAKRHKEQAEAKQQRDVVLKEVYSNKLDTTAYFSQFGTSHR